MNLPTRPLGTSGLDITAVGFGAWAAGGGDWRYGWGPQDDEASAAAIRHALDLGVGWIDTAAAYGLGHSEQVVGDVVRTLPAALRPLVFTKGGVVSDPARPFEEPVFTSRPDSIRAEVEASLRRLGTDRIDLYQLHWPDRTGVPVEDSWGELARLADEGTLGALGVSNFTVALLDRIEPIRHVDSIQPPFSLVLRDAAADVIPWAAAHGTGVVVYSPMQSGILTDSFTADRVAALDPKDWRRTAGPFQQPGLDRSLALRDALRPIARRHETTVGAVAVAWVLAWPGVSGAIVGARSRAQVDGWIDAARIELTAEDLDGIADAIDATGAGSGPAHPGASLAATGV
ncbi:MAG TPA: aldo/keto reductase [Candidatus Limnocylindrales bacterium]|nr:aldo/keto reductase [Candidatus Limnocylindrales bacterium]